MIDAPSGVPTAHMDFIYGTTRVSVLRFRDSPAGVLRCVEAILFEWTSKDALSHVAGRSPGPRSSCTALAVPQGRPWWAETPTRGHLQQLQLGTFAARCG